MKFELNGKHWEIIKLDNVELHTQRRIDGKIQNDELKEDSFYYGYENPVEQKIYLNKLLCKEQLKSTLIHELVHCWLWTMGSSYNSYCEDALCDTVSASYDFIHKTVEDYFKNKKDTE